MKFLNWLWWLGSPIYGLISAGYAIAYAGYGLSFWTTKPNPDSFILSCAFASAALLALNSVIKDIQRYDRGSAGG